MLNIRANSLRSNMQPAAPNIVVTLLVASTKLLHTEPG